LHILIVRDEPVEPSKAAFPGITVTVIEPYTIGLAALVSGDLAYAEEMFVDVENRLRNAKVRGGEPEKDRLQYVLGILVAPYHRVGNAIHETRVFVEDLLKLPTPGCFNLQHLHDAHAFLSS